MSYHLRIARPVSDLKKSEEMYCQGLGFLTLARFEDHDGFDGVMIGNEGEQFHLEFVSCRHHPVQPSPTVDDLLVFYLPDPTEWAEACDKMEKAGFMETEPFNPYWKNLGKTFQDHDGYLVVLENSHW